MTLCDKNYRINQNPIKQFLVWIAVECTHWLQKYCISLFLAVYNNIWKHQNVCVKIKTHRRGANRRTQRRDDKLHMKAACRVRNVAIGRCPRSTTRSGHRLRRLAACILSPNDVSSTRSDPHLRTPSEVYFSSIDGGRRWLRACGLTHGNASEERISWRRCRSAHGPISRMKATHIRPLVYKPSVSASRRRWHRHKF